MVGVAHDPRPARRSRRAPRWATGTPPPDGVRATDRAPFGWAPVVVLFLVGLVDRIETSVIAGVLPLIQAEWGVSDLAAGAMPTAAAIAGAIVALPAGYAADRATRTRLIAVVVAIWSVVTLGSAVAISFGMLFATRVLLGAADNIDNPSSSSLLADYYPPVTRARVFGWARLTHYAGLAIGVILGGVVGEAFGWRAAFAVMIVPGLVVAWLCWRLREPVRGFLDSVVATGGTDPVPVPHVPPTRWFAVPVRSMWSDLRRQLREIAQVRTLTLVCIGLAALTFGLSGVFYWLPSLLVRTVGLSEGPAASVAGGVGLVGVIGGVLLGGRLGDRWHRTRVGGRLLAGGGGLLIGTALLPAALLATELWLLALLLTLAYAAMAVAIPTLMAAIADVLVATSRGVGFAVLTFLVTLGGAFGPLLIGAISDATGSLRAGMFATVPLMAIAGILVLRARRSVDAEADAVLDAARATSFD